MFFLCWKCWISSFQGQLLVNGSVMTKKNKRSNVEPPNFGELATFIEMLISVKASPPTSRRKKWLRSIPINPIWRNDSRSCMFLTSAECFKIFKLPLAVKFCDSWYYNPSHFTKRKMDRTALGIFRSHSSWGEIGYWWTTFADALNLAHYLMAANR